MLLIYRISLSIYATLIWLASFFSSKAKLFLSGRSEQRFRLKKTPGSSPGIAPLSALYHSPEASTNRKRIWFHFASLGEFEQGRSLIEIWKINFPEDRIVLSFFSPSGYEIRKNYALADEVYYLPLDGKKSSLEFIRQIRPDLAVFTKYDYWYYYFFYLHRQGIPLYMISVILRPDQIFFKWYGSLFRKLLGFVSWFFVQDETSLKLLNSVGLTNAGISGDTRFDRVTSTFRQRKDLPLIPAFTGDSPVFIAGSTWPDDEKIVVELMQNPVSSGWKFIIAPHEIGQSHLAELLEHCPQPAVFYSEWAASQTGQPRLLIIDNIGMLSSIYRYGHLAYIGGGFGSGIHNILEAGVYGIPVLFGPVYQKFREAHEAIALGGAFSIKNEAELITKFTELKQDQERTSAGKKLADYISNSCGATDQILDHIRKDQGNA